MYFDTVMPVVIKGSLISFELEVSLTVLVNEKRDTCKYISISIESLKERIGRESFGVGD